MGGTCEKWSGKNLPLGLFFLLSVLDIDIMHGLDTYKPQGFKKIYLE